MENTTAQEVFDCFESSFGDKKVIPFELELIWLKRAISRYSVEVEPLAFSEESLEFDSPLDGYVIDTLGTFMRLFYQERELSRVNKAVSITGKDISIDAMGHTKTAAKAEAEYYKEKSEKMAANQKSAAYI